ncbi:phosphoenolpyruvate mutase [Viridibacillus sp. YIM B01967]|uniref:phosphoenolpyruvate mutase n=1 Tax=Viridibacillus soli TaxID=2798301 RepID=A0ABS1H5Z7_9BACL|nr:phosphoenolpyruvate mutase [Viridibacillus soli]MBK3494842.1 phosphoenolpyruvate mutase [Viridibacillus soli]
MKKTTQLKNMLQSNNLEFIMEAHNGLSAKIVENTGFKGIWASGLSISAALGVRDNNEASWTQVLEVIEFMSDTTNIPILLDGDTGYGNFNNMRRLVRKLEQRGIAGVCIEDKLFPKTNSFINSEAQPLADIDEFCGKIQAAKDAQTDPDFVVVARVEAFIAGWGLDEALKRAEAYRLAGADAILMHSKKSNASEIKAFMDAWGDRHPVIIVPTKYYSTPTTHFTEWGVSLVIWANHNVRAAITAMEETTKQIFEDQSLMNVEGSVASVGHIFELQGANELKEAEKKYLPTYGQEMNAIILAASRGLQLGDLTEDIPKTMLKVNGEPILHTMVSQFNAIGIKDITVVRGYKREMIDLPNVKMLDNIDFEQTKDLDSLIVASKEIRGTTVIAYGDILFKSYVLNELLNDDNDITIVVDAHVAKEGRNPRDFIYANQHCNRKDFSQKVILEKMSPKIPVEKAFGEFVGLWKVTETGASIILSHYEKVKDIAISGKWQINDFFNSLLEKNDVYIKYIDGSWLDVDDIVDLQKAEEIK